MHESVHEEYDAETSELIKALRAAGANIIYVEEGHK